MLHSHIKEYDIFNKILEQHKLSPVPRHCWKNMGPILLIVANVITISGFNSVGMPVNFFIAGCFCVKKTDLEYWIVRCNYSYHSNYALYFTSIYIILLSKGQCVVINNGAAICVAT